MWIALGLLRVQALQQVELAALFSRRLAAGKIVDRNFLGRHSGLAKRRPLKRGGQERTTIVSRAPITAGRTNGNEARQVFILCAQAVQHPRSHRGTNLRGGTAMEKQRGRAVSNAFGVQPAQHAQTIDVPRHFGKQLRHPTAALPVLGELPGRIHHALRRFAFPAIRAQTAHRRTAFSCHRLEPGAAYSRTNQPGSRRLA